MTAGTAVASAAALAGIAVSAAGFGWGSDAAVVAAQGVAAAALLLLGARAVPRPPVPRLPDDDAAAEAGRRQWSGLYQLQTAVMIGTQSRHHYDQGLRPRLQRVLHAVLAGRHGIDSQARPDLAADRVGPELWPLVDPERPPSRDSRPGGVSVPALGRLVDRIARL